MKTTFSRTFSTFAVILLAALILVGVSFQLLAKNFLRQQAVDRLKNDCSTISQLAAAYYTDQSFGSRDFLVNLSVATKVSNSNAVICNTKGTLLLCSDEPFGCQHQGLQLSGDEFMSRIDKQEYITFTGKIEGLYEDIRYVVSTAIHDPQTGRLVGFVMVSAPISASMAVLERLTDIYLTVSVLVVLLAVVIITFYTRRSSIPLRNMAKTAVAFGHGDLKARAAIPQHAPAEIHDLALAFNNMAQSLEKSEYLRQEFVANVSHELKTPMTTIGGYVDGILDGTIPAEAQGKYLQIVSDETKRLSRLVRSMLDVAQLQNGIPHEKKSRFDICESAGQVLITFEQKITDKEISVEVDMPEHPVYTFASQDAIWQVLYNLTDNAVKFCPVGGMIRLQVRESDAKIYVSVSNDGPTIPPQELPLLFDRFHKLDKSRSENRDGWGLGLYIVKTIVCSHGEDISVSSRDDKTEFTFTLPVAN